MKILECYTRMAKQLIVEQEVDDDKIIKYKDKEGESQEMTAGAAKKQPDEHPAKIAYNKIKDSDGGEKDSGGKLGGSDFERDFDDKSDEPKGKSKDDNAESDDIEISDANSGPIDTDDIMDMLKNDSEIVDKMGDDVYWDGMDLVSSKFDDDTIASIPDDSNMTLGDLKKQIMDYEGEEDDDEPKGISKDEEDENRKEEAESALTDISGIDFDEFEQGPEGYDMMMNALENLEGSSITRDKKFKKLVDDLETNQDKESALAIKAYLNQVFASPWHRQDDNPEEPSSVKYDKIYPDDEDDDEPKKKKGFFSKMFGKRESIVINGKKYKAIKESKEHIFKRTYKKIGGK